MRLKDKVSVLEAKTRPQRWAAYLRSINDNDEVRMQILLDLCQEGDALALLPMPAAIKARFTKIVDSWNSDPEPVYEVEQVDLSNTQQSIAQVASVWTVFHDVPAEFRQPEAIEMLLDGVASWLNDAVPGALDLSDFDLMRLGNTLSERLVSAPDSCAGVLASIEDSLALVRSAVKVECLKAV